VPSSRPSPAPPASTQSTSPTRRGSVLYDYVDLDALDTLVAGHSGSGVDISLSVAGYEVSVDATAAVAERTR